MALTDENGGMGTTMLVGPTGYAGGNGGFGFGNDWSWLIVLFLFGMFNGGWGGFGGGNQLGYDFPWLLNGQNGINANTNTQFAQAATQSAIGDLSTAVNTGFGNVATQLCGGFAGVNANIANGFAQAEIAENSRQMANMNQMYGIQSALQNCCCENRANIADLKYTVATENCADRAAVSDGIRDLLAATQAQTQTILTQMCNDKIEAKNDTIAQLRSELMYARGQASQDVQTAAIQAGQRALANEVEQYVAPKAIPAYLVANPACCNQYNGCGCAA